MLLSDLLNNISRGCTCTSTDVNPLSFVKVAGMESQMISLKQYVRETDAQREKVELKLAEAIARDHQNQVIRESSSFGNNRRSLNFVHVVI